MLRNRCVWSLIGVVNACCVLALAGEWWERSLPGRPATEDDLTAWQGTICGMGCGTTGNFDCGPVTHECEVNGRLCVNEADSCGTCTGEKHITCQVLGGEQDWCSEYSEPCCRPPGKCQQRLSACECDPERLGENQYGSRIRCTVEHNSPYCRDT